MCEAKGEDELEDASNGARLGIVGPGDENVGVFWGLERAEGGCCKKALKERDRVVLDGSFVLLQDVLV